MIAMKKLLLVIVALFSILSIQAQTIDELKAKAEQGLAEAQNKLGDCYRLGDGVTKDYAEAVKWYRKAAKQGHKGAKEKLDELGLDY